MNYRLSLVLLFQFLTQISSGQLLINQGNVISITEDAVLSINGDATNNGRVINNGSLSITGTWINNEIYEAGIGNFVLNSTDDQIVNHNAQSFSKLTISGGGRKIFQAELTIDESLNLENGILVSENNSRLIISREAEVTGGSSLSYIVGPVIRQGLGTLFFPVGSNIEYLPVRFDEVSGTDVEIEVQAISEAPPGEAGSSLSSLTDRYYWLLLRSGFEEGKITLPVKLETSSQTLADVEIAASSDGIVYDKLDKETTAGNLSDGSITAFDIEGNQYYTLGYIAESSEVSITVINAVTPSLKDDKHDFLRIDNIESFPANQVKIFNRWGDLVFEINEYDNEERVFKGRGNVSVSEDLESGTYYYVIKLGNGQTVTGFFLLVQ